MPAPRLPPGWGGPKEGYTPNRSTAVAPSYATPDRGNYSPDRYTEPPSFAPPPDERLQSTPARKEMIKSLVPSLDFSLLRGGHRKPAAPVALAALKALPTKSPNKTPQKQAEAWPTFFGDVGSSSQQKPPPPPPPANIKAPTALAAAMKLSSSPASKPMHASSVSASAASQATAAAKAVAKAEETSSSEESEEEDDEEDDEVEDSEVEESSDETTEEEEAEAAKAKELNSAAEKKAAMAAAAKAAKAAKAMPGVMPSVEPPPPQPPQQPSPKQRPIAKPLVTAASSTTASPNPRPPKQPAATTTTVASSSTPSSSSKAAAMLAQLDAVEALARAPSPFNPTRGPSNESLGASPHRSACNTNSGGASSSSQSVMSNNNASSPTKGAIPHSIAQPLAATASSSQQLQNQMPARPRQAPPRAPSASSSSGGGGLDFLSRLAAIEQAESSPHIPTTNVLPAVPESRKASPAKHGLAGAPASPRGFAIEQDHSSDCGNHSDITTSSAEHRTGHAHGKSGGGGRVRKHIASIESTGGAAAQSPAAASSTSGASMRSSPRAKRSLPFAQGPPLAPSSSSSSQPQQQPQPPQQHHSPFYKSQQPTPVRLQGLQMLAGSSVRGSPSRHYNRGGASPAKSMSPFGHSPGQKSAGGGSKNSTPVRSRNASPARRPNSPGVVGSGGASRQRRAGSPPPARQLGGGGSPEVRVNRFRAARELNAA